jgi:hypothetical protein
VKRASPSRRKKPAKDPRHEEVLLNNNNNNNNNNEDDTLRKADEMNFTSGLSIVRRPIIYAIVVGALVGSLGMTSPSSDVGVVEVTNTYDNRSVTAVNSALQQQQHRQRLRQGTEMELEPDEQLLTTVEIQPIMRWFSRGVNADFIPVEN